MADEEKQEIKNEELVEAVLFLAGRFLTLQELVMFTDLNPLTLKEVIEKLKRKYEKHTTLEITIKENAYKMDVKPHCAHLVNKLATGSTEFTKAEQETLAIVAYKQPITQAIVVKIRGNKAYDHIKHLVQAGLIKTKRAGRTFELGVEEKFYDYFNIAKKQQKAEEAEQQQAEEQEEQTEKTEPQA